MTPPRRRGLVVALPALLALSIVFRVGIAHAHSRAAPHVVELTLTAAPARLSLVPGETTGVFAYNGQVPGPTLEFHEGDHVVIHFHNHLTETSTIHLHGIHLPAVMDGSPLEPVKPGESYDYVFDVLPGSAGTYWYHPHPDARTGYQVAKGLYGALIIRPAHDPLEGIPEQLLVLADNRIRSDGAVDMPPPESLPGEMDEENGREGNIVFVNGKIMPTISIRSGQVQRWRVVNASAARYYRLAIAGYEFLQVGTDGGLFDRPVPVHEVLLAPAERAEFLVRATSPPGSRAVLRAMPYDHYMPQTRPEDWDVPRDILTLQYTNEAAVTPVNVPDHLRAIAALDTNTVTVRRTIVFTQGMINNKVMDMNRVDEHAQLGATEIWELDNAVGMDHPFHLHGFQFQVLDRDGVPEPFPAWHDIVNVPKHAKARIIVRFSDYPGKWMYHCHILDHEDEGMMGILEVSSPTRR